ncbi:hypothetical protein MNBD_CHLOROFLEXI01-3200 [hydrothermal vent metagenome]|uniref:Restriction endonuclease type IV Mrr domain-containing protein n=1 Tax=hydrothermal vent metagenome TaxID=652676 RepID=A0A3B0UW69_9ZZZZ
MAQRNELVTLIRYGFSIGDLFANRDSDLYEIEETGEKYTKLCKEALQKYYPNAEIELEEHSTDSVLPTSAETSVYKRENLDAVKTSVYKWENMDFDEVLDSEECEVVDQICDDVFKRGKWPVRKNLVLIRKLNDPNLPLSVIRWAGVQGVINGTNQTGLWEVSPSDVYDLHKIIKFVRRENITSIFDTDSKIACLWEDVQDLQIANLQENTLILIASHNGFGSFLETDSSLLIISRKNLQINITVDHFVDIVKWSDSQWSYSTYVEELINQAKGKEVNCVLQDDGLKNSTHGISFHFSKISTPIVTVGHLIDEALKELSEIINNTELSLKGGPVWNHKYEKDEDLFCKEVLHPLLQKMGFSFVRYIHGTNEFGKDFLFSDISSPLHEPVYFVLQAKRGDVSGGANSLLDTILSQIDDTFTVPYTGEAGTSEIYIAIMIVAISGNFTSNAVTKIRYKMPQHLKGSVYFWDQQRIRSLINQCWRKENN